MDKQTSFNRFYRAADQT
ncbi:hypothetical protein VTP01DRAFT_7524 [Rhizomucor pusillus]